MVWGGGGGEGGWFPAHRITTCTGKGVKICQPISGPELTVNFIG